MRHLAEGVRRSGSALSSNSGRWNPRSCRAARGPYGRRPAGEADERRSSPARRATPSSPRSSSPPPATERGELPHGLRDLLLQRVAGSTRQAQGLLRVAAAAGRDVAYPLLGAVTALPEARTYASRCAGQSSTASSSPTGRPAASVSATRCSRRRSTRRSCPVSARSCTRAGRRARAQRSRGGGELAPHWEAAGRSTDALAASVEAARSGGGLRTGRGARAPRAGARPLARGAGRGRARRARPRRALHAGSRAGQPNGRGPRAAELGRRAIELVGEGDPLRAALLHVRLGEYLDHTGRNDAGLAAVERAVELVPAEPPSPERAYSLGSLAGALVVAWRHAESLPICEQALALARVSAHARQRSARSRCSAPTSPTSAAPRRGSPSFVRRCSSPRKSVIARPGTGVRHLTDVLTMLGRPGESARLGQEGLEAMRRYGITARCSPRTRSRRCSRSATGTRPTGSAPPRSAASPRASFWLLTVRAGVEIGRGELDAARAHLEAAGADLFEDRVLGLLRLLPRRPRALGAPLDGRGGGHRRGAGGARRPRRPKCASSSARRACARRRSWQRSHAPAATRRSSAAGSSRAS